MSSTASFFQGALEAFGVRVHGIPPDAWRIGTPCSEWDVRALVNHVAGEDLWVPLLLGGATVEEVGDRLEGDILGDDPVGTWDEACAAALEEAQRVEPSATVHVSFGEISADEYLVQVATDHVIHAWDLARATRQAEVLDRDLVEAAYRYIAPRVESWRDAGVFAGSVEVPPEATLQQRLLALTGRSWT